MTILSENSIRAPLGVSSDMDSLTNLKNQTGFEGVKPSLTTEQQKNVLSGVYDSQIQGRLTQRSPFQNMGGLNQMQQQQFNGFSQRQAPFSER